MAAGAVRKLQQELSSFSKEPLEGVMVSLADDDNFLKWSVGIFGPPDTLYEGGYFKTTLEFPTDYPFSPPKMKFVTPMWHPNVYPDGTLCISILHPPGHDEMSGERPEERWNPTQQVRTILLSVISLLNEPNTASPANVDASVAYRAWREGKSEDYKRRVEGEVKRSRSVAEAEGVHIPASLEEYCIKHTPVEQKMDQDWTLDDSDLEDEDFYEGSDDGDEDDFEFEEDDD
eukprot:m.160939 g.160939  ORF g.160939 m.160939 type:complete len:231 (+) comp17631_c5_seq2:2006-2698(+)